MQADDLIFKAKSGSKSANPSSITKTQDVINNGLGGSYANIDENGKLSLNVNREDLQTDDQKGLYDILNQAMTADVDVYLDVYESDKTIMGGSMMSHHPNGPGKIDIDDIVNFGNGELINSTSVLAHEVAETYEKQINGNTEYTNKEGTGAHDKANIAESKTNGGWVPGRSSYENMKAEKITERLPGGGTRTSVVKSATVITPLTNGNETRYFRYNVVQGNVVKSP